MVLEITTDPTDQGEIPTVARPRQAEIQFPIIFPHFQHISCQNTSPEPPSSRRIFGLGPAAAANRSCRSGIHPAQQVSITREATTLQWQQGICHHFPKQPTLLRTAAHTMSVPPPCSHHPSPCTADGSSWHSTTAFTLGVSPEGAPFPSLGHTMGQEYSPSLTNIYIRLGPKTSVGS